MTVRLPRLILHVGFQKTGTSSLQRLFRVNRAKLGDQGILYPQAGTLGKDAHHHLALQLNPAKTDGEDLGALIAALTREQTQPHHTLLLSSEAFQQINYFDRVADMIAHLAPAETIICAYVRELVDFKLSSFRQHVQAESTFQPLEDWMKWRFRIDRKLEGWRNHGDLRLAWFDRAQFYGGDIVFDMAQRCGIDLDRLDLQQDERNPSLGGNLLYFRMAANAAEADFLTYRQMSQLAQSHAPFRQPFYFSDAQAARIRKDSPYNDYLYAQLGPAREKSWESHGKLPDLDSWADDLDRIAPLLPAGPALLRDVPAAGTRKGWFTA